MGEKRVDERYDTPLDDIRDSGIQDLMIQLQ
jgi:hypothetical protein